MAGDTPVQPPLNTPPIAPSKPNLFVSPWALFFTDLANANNSGNAPSSAAYILAVANALLPNGRVGTTSTTIAWDYSASGQAKVNLRDTTVTPGTYGDATHVSQVTFDAQGRATAASNVAITATGTVTTTGSPVSGNLTKFSGATSITNGDLTGDVTTSGTLATTLANSGVTAGSYTSADITVNAKGLVTAAANGSSGGSGTVIGLNRALGDGSTTDFFLPDLAEYVVNVSDAGLIVDPTLYTLGSAFDLVSFGTAPTAGHVLTFEYVEASI